LDPISKRLLPGLRLLIGPLDTGAPAPLNVIVVYSPRTCYFGNIGKLGCF